MRFLLDLDKLRPGDIVLEAGAKLHSRLIMAATKGQYSHALLNVGVSLIEATVGGGVFSKNPQRLLVRDATNLAVYRMKTPLSEDTLKTIVMAARIKVGTLYAVDEALRVMHRDPEQSPANGQFCSRLVAQSYAAGDIILTSDPNFCSPQELAESPLLAKVEDAVRQANAFDIAFTKTTDIVRINQKATNNWLKAVRRIAAEVNKDIVAQSDVLPFLLSYPQYDARVMECIRRTSYLENLNHDRKANPQNYNLRILLSMLKQSGHPEIILRQELRKEPSLIERHGLNLSLYRQYADTGLEYVDAHIALNDGILAMAEQRLRVMFDALTVLQLDDLFVPSQCYKLLSEVLIHRQ